MIVSKTLASVGKTSFHIETIWSTINISSQDRRKTQIVYTLKYFIGELQRYRVDPIVLSGHILYIILCFIIIIISRDIGHIMKWQQSLGEVCSLERLSIN